MTEFLAFCFLAYFGVSGTITLMVNYKELNESAAVAVAFKQRGLSFMSYIIGTGATFGLLGNFYFFVFIKSLGCAENYVYSKFFKYVNQS